MKRIALTRFILFLFPGVLALTACERVKPSQRPQEREVFDFFVDQLKQTAKASGYRKYRLVIDKLQQDTTKGNCTTPDRTVVPCFTITVNRTEYLDNYTGTYTSVYIGDIYHLYRDEYGKLAVVDHTAGSVNTRQDHHADESNTL